MRKEFEGLYVDLAFLLIDYCGFCKSLTLFEHSVLTSLVQQWARLPPPHTLGKKFIPTSFSEVRKEALEMEVVGSTLDPKFLVKEERTICRTFLVED